MAKKNDLDHEPDDDFSGDSENPKPASGIQGFLSRLPFVGFVDSARDFFENIAMFVRGIFADKDKPFLPIALLGGVVVLLLMIAIILFAVLGSTLSSSSAPEKNATLSAKMDTSTTVEGQTERSQANDVGIRDPFLTRPILPDELLFMSKGEIHYQRVPAENWVLSDIVPGWQDLGGVYKTMLRERNSAEFHHLMGEEAQPPDRY